MAINKKSKPVELYKLFPIVGIGASAGGLDAFKKLLKAIPENSGMAYVLVQHLDPSHESLLPALLQKVTTIPVVEIIDEIKVKPDHIYIIPSNKMLVANDGVLQLSPRPAKSKNKQNLPIDLFFSSLAEVHQAHAIGIVLSGTASDGTQGLKAIKDHGGITFAQDEQSAIHPEMPRSAIQAGVVDFILPPEEIPGRLLEIEQQMNAGDTELQKEEEVFKQILSLLRIRKGTDFTWYKQTTIRRRILRRIALSKNEKPAGYLHYLREHTSEQDNLYQDLLIPVTSFFRDATIFTHLCESVFPSILKNKSPDDPIRVWVTGCSTGQEAYSIAMCLKEWLGDRQEKIQIFATDISEPAIEKARAGIYTKNEVAALSRERMDAFFTRVNGSYQIAKQVRNMCIFATHNFLKDPPFGKMDLISCRNVLIYMEPYLQKKALTTFHYALNEKGVLLLGKSETASGVPDLFYPVDKNDKLFIRKDVTGKFAQVIPGKGQALRNAPINSKSKRMHPDFQKAADDIMLNRYTPAGVVVNEALDIVHFRGSVGLYLEPAAGKPSHNLLKMAKSGLAFELRNILHKAKKDNGPVVKENIPLLADESQRVVSIEALPLPDMVDPHYLVLFHDSTPGHYSKPQKAVKTIASGSNKEKDLRMQQLEKELAQTREEVRSIIEDQEAANEELQSANEELLSGSEELQSLNEELETSKEELQTTNEELMVVNQELIGLNQQVTQARDYAEAIVSTVRTPLLVLNKKLQVVTANVSFYKFFSVPEAETKGRSIYELGNGQWNILSLKKLLEDILPKKANFNDFEVKHTFPVIGERVMLLNACEIAKGKAEEKLILLAIEDITERIQVQKQETAFRQQLKEKIEERTRELNNANEELQQKNQDLLRLNKELESFTYISSHDLQEPLRKIQTFANHIVGKEEALLTEKGKDYFVRMQNAASRMQTLIEDLLVYSRTTIADRQFRKTDLNKVVEEVKTEFAETIKEKKAIIEADQLCIVKVNTSQFRQVINNLVSNALKFSRPGVPPHIIIKSKIGEGSQLQQENPYLLPERLSSRQQYCHIRVTDNGIGFDPKYQEQIFEVFQRLYGKDEYPGNGIGLAIVKKIITNHDGFVIATGEFSKGATFDIYIPVA